MDSGLFALVVLCGFVVAVLWIFPRALAPKPPRTFTGIEASSRCNGDMGTIHAGEAEKDDINGDQVGNGK